MELINFCKKINKQKPHLNRVGRPDCGAPMPCKDSREGQEEEKPPLLSWRALSQWKVRDSMFTIAFHLSFPFPVQKLARVLSWLPTLNCNPLLILNKPIFAAEISGSLFISGQHYIHLMANGGLNEVWHLKHIAQWRTQSNYSKIEIYLFSSSKVELLSSILKSKYVPVVGYCCTI